jgi:NADP-dependent 3-hydroxy acid dehydrogenase YdfG
MKIEDQVIAVTGASGGIGEATARLLTAQGARVVLAARRQDRLACIVDEIQTRGGHATSLAIDVTRPEDLHGGSGQRRSFPGPSVGRRG